MQTARVLKLLLPGLRLRCSVLSKATAAGTDFGKVCPGSAVLCRAVLCRVVPCWAVCYALLCGIPGRALPYLADPRSGGAQPASRAHAASASTASVLGPGLGPCRQLPHCPQLPTPRAPPLPAQVDILMAQPLRLGAMAEEGGVELSGCRLLVLDEADKLFDMGFTQQAGGRGGAGRGLHWGGRLGGVLVLGRAGRTAAVACFHDGASRRVPLPPPHTQPSPPRPTLPHRRWTP